MISRKKFDKNNRKNLTSSLAYNEQLDFSSQEPTMLMTMAQKMTPARNLHIVSSEDVHTAIEEHYEKKNRAIASTSEPKKDETDYLHRQLKRPKPTASRLDTMLRHKSNKGLGLDLKRAGRERPNPALTNMILQIGSNMKEGSGEVTVHEPHAALTQSGPRSAVCLYDNCLTTPNNQIDVDLNNFDVAYTRESVSNSVMESGTDRMPSAETIQMTAGSGSEETSSTDLLIAVGNQPCQETNDSGEKELAQNEQILSLDDNDISVDTSRDGKKIDPSQTLTRFEATSSPIPKPVTLAQKVVQHVKRESPHESLAGDLDVASVVSQSDRESGRDVRHNQPDLVHPAPKRLVSGDLAPGTQLVTADVVQNTITDETKNEETTELHDTCDPKELRTREIEANDEYPSPDMTKVPFQYARVDPDRDGVFEAQEQGEDSPRGMNDLVEGTFQSHPVFRPSPKIQIRHHSVFDDVGRVYGTPNRRSIGSLYLPPEAKAEELDASMVFYPAPIPSKLLVPPLLRKPEEITSPVSTSIDTLGFQISKQKKRKSVQFPIPPPVWSDTPRVSSSAETTRSVRASTYSANIHDSEGFSDTGFDYEAGYHSMSENEEDDTDAATIESDNNSYQEKMGPDSPAVGQENEPERKMKKLYKLNGKGKSKRKNRLNLFRKTGEAANGSDDEYEAIDDTQAFTTYNEANLRSAILAYEESPKPNNFVEFNGAKNLIEELEMRKLNKQYHQRTVIRDATHDAATQTKKAMEEYLHPLDRRRSMSLMDLQRLADLDYRSQVKSTIRARAPEQVREEKARSIMARSEVNGSESLSALRRRMKAQKQQEAQEEVETLAQRRARLKRERLAAASSGTPMNGQLLGNNPFGQGTMSHVSVN